MAYRTSLDELNTRVADKTYDVFRECEFKSMSKVNRKTWFLIGIRIFGNRYNRTLTSLVDVKRELRRQVDGY